MEQFLAAQMQLLQNPMATVANMQAQQNQQAPVVAPQPRDKHREFMSHPPNLLPFSGSSRCGRLAKVYYQEAEYNSVHEP